MGWTRSLAIGPLEWPGAESNRRHHDFQSCALPTELPGQKKPPEPIRARARSIPMENVRLYRGRTPVRTSGRDQVSASSHPGTGSPRRTEREAQLPSPEANSIRTVLSAELPPRPNSSLGGSLTWKRRQWRRSDPSNSGGRIRTCDLRVMSPTSYQTAPPRNRDPKYRPGPKGCQPSFPASGEGLRWILQASFRHGPSNHAWSGFNTFGPLCIFQETNNVGPSERCPSASRPPRPGRGASWPAL